MSNPFFQIQARVKALLEAKDHFAGVKIVTEELGDIDYLIESQILNLGFGLVIATGEGQAERAAVLRLDETIVVSIVHATSMDKTRNVLDTLSAAILALHYQPVDEAAQLPRVNRERFHVIGHRPVPAEQAPEGVHIHQLVLTAPLTGAWADTRNP